MSIVREASATWQGNITDGEGHINLNAGVASGRYTLATRLGEEQGMDPERLVAGALASCYAMALAKRLAGEGHTPSTIEVIARVYLEKEKEELFIPTLAVVAHAYVDNLKDDKFEAISRAALEHCPVANLAAGANIRLEAHHISS